MSQWKINKIMKTQLIPVFACDWYLIYEDVYHSIKIFIFFGSLHFIRGMHSQVRIDVNFAKRKAK